MGLITYNSLADNTPITANVFNERFGEIIALLNGGLDQTNFTAGGIPPAALNADVFAKIYPVGSLYFNATDSTDPATLLGFGTWVAFGAGRVPVGYSATDTDFNASEKTGGAKTHRLTGAESGTSAHSHIGSTQAAGSHDHDQGFVRGTSGTFGILDSQHASSSGSARTGAGGNHAHGVVINNSTEANASTAHANLQPFITVYIYKRTA